MRKERTEHLEARESVVKMDYKEKEDNLVQEDSVVVWEDLVVLESLDPRETLGSLGHLALWESKESQGLKAPGVLLEKLVYLVYLERNDSYMTSDNFYILFTPRPPKIKLLTPPNPHPIKFSQILPDPLAHG